MSFLHESVPHLPSAKSVDYTSLGEIEFQRMVSLERRRASRSQKSSLLLLFEMNEGMGSNSRTAALKTILSAMRHVTRETDIAGWYKDHTVVGVMFTEITFDTQGAIPPGLINRLNETLRDRLTPAEFRHVSIKVHFLSEAESTPAVTEKYAPVYSDVTAPHVAIASSL